ncbi:MAG: hypothetical protein KGJ66_06075 [Alphaproteobacteria bacterium]|nr:hypothetical protein [Alphaproteobacteria bacterium]
MTLGHPACNVFVLVVVTRKTGRTMAAACAADKHYDFLFVAPALPVTGAVGLPVNPLAIR